MEPKANSFPSCDDFDWSGIPADMCEQKALELVTEGNNDENYRAEDVPQFLVFNRLEALKPCFIKHDITMSDLNTWSPQDAKYGVPSISHQIIMLSNISKRILRRERIWCSY